MASSGLNPPPPRLRAQVGDPGDSIAFIDHGVAALVIEGSEAVRLGPGKMLGDAAVPAPARTSRRDSSPSRGFGRIEHVPPSVRTRFWFRAQDARRAGSIKTR